MFNISLMRLASIHGRERYKARVRLAEETETEKTEKRIQWRVRGCKVHRRRERETWTVGERCYHGRS